MGDAAGIGPEVIVKALSSEEIRSLCNPVVIGDASILQNTVNNLDILLSLHPIEDISHANIHTHTINVLDLHNLKTEDVVTGQICPACGKAAMEYIAAAAGLAMNNQAAAIVTAPINKEATTQAGYGDIGHLEYLARLSGASEYATMLVSGNLRVVHLTTHYSLKDACSMVTSERILSRLRLTYDSFRKWGTNNPCIAVAALNPHGGEGGLFGKEEIEHISPAITGARNLGIDARGPFPADSVFNRAIDGEFDVVLALYHDQGHIAVKVHGFEQSVSVALGLPFIRTSVDHGTAFDIAGKGMADSRSMQQAIKTAVRLVQGNYL